MFTKLKEKAMPIEIMVVQNEQVADGKVVGLIMVPEDLFYLPNDVDFERNMRQAVYKLMRQFREKRADFDIDAATEPVEEEQKTRIVGDPNEDFRRK
jgi:hypothetical protein